MVSTFDHDEQGRLISQKQSVGEHLRHKRQYHYGALGNLSDIEDTRDGHLHYDYDPLSRLTVVRGNIEERFVHDEAGNLLSQSLGHRISETLSDARGNQLSFHGDAYYEYDEFGRLVAEKRGKNQALVTRYEYDCQHRMTSASMPDGSTASYQYDAFGRRIKKTVVNKLGEQTVTEFVWQGDNLVAELQDSERYQSYLYEPGTFRPLALLKGEGKAAEVFYYHLDQIGTPIDMTDAQGSSVWSVQYRAYGNVVKQVIEEVDNPLRFQGQYCDAETGLHYNRHRYYSPSTGRFTTIDPIGLAGGLNNYQYVPNPTGWVDPLGLAGQAVSGPCGCKILPNGKIETKESILQQADEWVAKNPDRLPPNISHGGNRTKADLDILEDMRNDLAQNYAKFNPIDDVDRRFRFVDSDRPNFSYATSNIDGKSSMLKAFSGEGHLDGYVDAPADAKRMLTTTVYRNMDRALDTEAKIMEQVLKDTTSDSLGTVRLFSKIDICGSCQGVITQLALSRPKLNIEVVTKNKGTKSFMEGVRPDNVRK